MYSEMWLRTTVLQHLNSIQDQSARVYFKQFKNLGLLLSHALISSFTIKLQKKHIHKHYRDAEEKPQCHCSYPDKPGVHCSKHGPVREHSFMDLFNIIHHPA